MLVVMRGDRKEVRSSGVAADREAGGGGCPDGRVMRDGDVQGKELQGEEVGAPEEGAPSEVALGVCAPPAPRGRRKRGASSSTSSSI